MTVTDFEKRGLTSQEAKRRLIENGRNELSGKKKASAAALFAGQFKDTMVLILLVATALSAVMGEIHEALAIVAIVLLNALLGFFQEMRCEHTLEALSKLSAPTARVRRDGREMEIPASEVVCADVIMLSAGDCVAADAVLFEAHNLKCDESLLTGESLPVDKNARAAADTLEQARESMAFMGTHVVNGRGEALVTATGMSTEMGAIAGMLGSVTQEDTPLQQRLDQVGRTIGAACVLICAAVASVGILRGEAPLDMLITGISLAVAAVPEGLPAIVTISLALSVRRILAKNALVKHLHAVETLGCVTVICSDKTGTLTQNRMTVMKAALYDGIISAQKAQEGSGQTRLLLQCAAFCNDARLLTPSGGILKLKREKRFEGEPTETALLKLADSAGVHAADFHRVGEIPFSSEKKRMTVWGSCPDGKSYVFIKGAPESVLSCCDRVLTGGGAKPLDERERKRIAEQNLSMASEALRVLAFAYKPQEGAKNESGLIFLGLLGMMDPPRPQVPAAVESCRKAHVRTVMITGDHADTARAVARQIGITKGGVVNGADIDRMSDEALCECCKSAAVFARVTPAHKLRIVSMMKKNGEIVAMTGDGVNDAPAVKEASIGVAMGEGGTDVTREAADVILLDDNFATLVSAVAEGRAIYQNIRRFLRYLLSCNAGEVATMFFGMLMGMPVVLMPIQLLLVNLVTDGLPAVALGMEGADERAMKRPPRKADESVFAGGLPGKIMFRGLLIGITTLGVFSSFLKSGESLEAARTAALLTLIMTQLFHVFECRSEDKGLLQLNPFGNPFLLVSVLFSVLCVALAIYTPLGAAVFASCPLSFLQLRFVLLCSAAVPLVNSLALMLSGQGRLTGKGR